MADIEIPGTNQKIPTWVLIAGGAGAFVLALITRKQSTSNAPTQEDTSALLTSELTMQMQEGWQNILEWMRYQMGIGQGTVPVSPPNNAPPEVLPPDLSEPITAPNGSTAVRKRRSLVPPIKLLPGEEAPYNPWLPAPPESPSQGIGGMLLEPAYVSHSLIGAPGYIPTSFTPGLGGKGKSVPQNNTNQPAATSTLPSGKFPGFASLAVMPSYTVSTPATRGSSNISINVGGTVKGVAL